MRVLFAFFRVLFAFFSVLFAFFSVVFCLLCSLPAPAALPSVVVIVLPPATLRDWQSADAPALHRLMQTGSLAVMNTRTAHQAGRSEPETAQSALLTLGAGARAAGTGVPARFYSSSSSPGMNVSVAALFQRRTGAAAPPGEFACLDWPAVVAANRGLGYDLTLGNLTDTLAAHGVSVASGGGANADWLAAGSRGTVHRSSELRAAPGVCLIWEAGPDLKYADAVLAAASTQVAAVRGRLVVLSPQAGTAKDKRLAPVLVWGPGVPAGLLYSPSTHRRGLVTNTDFAPSLASYFGIPRNHLQTLPFGFAWMEVRASDPVGICERLNQEAGQQAQGMRLLPYAAAVLSFWILAASVLSFRFALPQAALFVPLGTVIAALFALSLLSFCLLLLVLVGLAVTVKSPRLPAAISILAVLAVCADMGTGNTLMHRGMLGYSALEGARYYGIGNEAMGLLLGAFLLAVCSLWQPNKGVQFVLIGFMTGIVALLGSAGAKAGGVMVSIAVFSTFLYTASGRPWTVRIAALLAAVVFAAMGLAVAGDLFLRTGSHSHVAEAVARIAQGGMGEAWDIITRKLAVEGRLAYHSAWALLLWLGLGCTSWLWRKLPARDNRDNAGRTAGIVGLAACLLLNDAGVVAAAIFGVFLWTAAVTQKNTPALDVSKAGGV